MTCVLLATPGASGGRWCVPARSSARPTVSTGSARLAIAATVATERNCVRACRPLVAISPRTRFHQHTRCSGSMVNMARGPFSPISLASLS